MFSLNLFKSIEQMSFIKSMWIIDKATITHSQHDEEVKQLRRAVRKEKEADVITYEEQLRRSCEVSCSAADQSGRSSGVSCLAVKDSVY